MTKLRALVVPSGTQALDTTEGARQLLKSLRKASSALLGRTSVELARILGEVGLRFLDPDDSIRREAEQQLPDEAGISAPMASEIVQGMARNWTPERLERVLRTDFPDPAVLDELRSDGAGQFRKAVGGSLAFHIGSGNVPGVGATSMIRSLLVKCPVLVKPGPGDVALPSLFARALSELEPELAASVAVVYWPRGNGGSLEDEAIRAADRVVAYGGAELVSALRGRLPSTTPLVAYHHRLSVGAVARECLDSGAGAESIASNAARSVATFDQRGCVSPLIIWVEESAGISPVEWAELLGEQLEALAHVLPPGRVTDADAASLQQAMGTSRLKGATGSGDRVFSGEGGTVFYDPEAFGAPSVSGAGRTVVVKPIGNLSRLPEVLRPASRVLQTLALAAPEPRRGALAELLSGSGLTRITSFKAQPWPPAWWCHDGKGPLQALVRWVVLEPAQ